MRARTRAVTADDFERLTLAASPDVARAICVAAGTGAAIRVHVLPRVGNAERRLTLEELTPSGRLMQELAAALEDRRLIGTSIQLLPPRFKGVSVAVDVRTLPLADPERVREDITHALYVYLNPLVGGSPDGPGAGWPAGRGLNQGELFGVVHAIPGVESVNVLRVYETDVRTGAQAAQPSGGHLALAADELIASGEHIVRTGS
jgi:predicted phage baseplate assembly protein